MKIQVRFCPSGQPTTDADYNFPRVPCIGELVEHDGSTYAIVYVHWFPEATVMVPLVVAHSLDRPRAQAPFG